MTEQQNVLLSRAPGELQALYKSCAPVSTTPPHTVVDTGAFDPYHACNSPGTRVSSSLQPFSSTAWP